ncbi:MAG: tetratricopeptide repeat protein [Verrucomicrobiae bacterium]|nr:tetratricopeptide repeat protein [Verrucomicrobiae bacterium]
MIAGLAAIGLTGVERACADEPALIANRLENEGIEAWRSGDFERGAELIEKSIAQDPTNPQRALNYGSLLMLRGRALTDDGQPEAAAKALEESERQLSAAVRLGEGLPGCQQLVGQGFFLLGEIAFYARKDLERAAKFYVSAAKRLPDDQRIRAALERTGRDVTSFIPEVRKSSPTAKLTIASAHTVSIGGETLRLANEDDNQTVHVKEYVPPGESMETWSTLFAERKHRRFVSPETYASLIAEQVAKQGGKVISTSAGPGDSANIVFVVHSPSMFLSEVNAWNLRNENGTLVSEQFAHRIRGDYHHAKSEEMAREKSEDWVVQLQARHAVQLVETSEVSPGQEGE